jgi:hypothetical protein
VTSKVVSAGGLSLPQNGYFSDVFRLEKDVLRVEPRPLTAAMMARLMPAAISAYSIAVAPDRFAKNRNSARFKATSWYLHRRASPGAHRQSVRDEMLICNLRAGLSGRPPPAPRAESADGAQPVVEAWGPRGRIAANMSANMVPDEYL